MVPMCFRSNLSSAELFGNVRLTEFIGNSLKGLETTVAPSWQGCYIEQPW